MKNFQTVMKEHFDKLKLYVPVVERVHGKTHPEFYEVRKAYDQIMQKYQEQGKELDLSGEFAELREVTQNYRIPEDTCESYEAVYQMLEELDKAYHS